MRTSAPLRSSPGSRKTSSPAPISRSSSRSRRPPRRSAYRPTARTCSTASPGFQSRSRWASTALASAADSSLPSPVTTASRPITPRRRSACRRCSSASCRGPGGANASRGSSVRVPRSTSFWPARASAPPKPSSSGWSTSSLHRPSLRTSPSPRRRITKFEYARLVALLSGGDTYAGFGRAELTIEAVFEELGVKQQVLREVEAVIPPTGVFASNTSTIPITRIAEAAHAPERVIGMHFFSPVARMPLLEVIPGARTDAQTISTAVAFGRRMGKTVIVVQDSPGFWVNRILAPYANEIGHLLAEGASIEDIDSLAVRFGFPVGPVTLLDEVGLDVALKVAAVMQEAYGEHIVPIPGEGIAALVKAGRLGRKSGRGFYLYEGGKKRGVDER